MKKHLLIIIIVFSFSGKTMAQEKRSSFLTLTTGPSFPTGDFANKDLSNEAGQANTGAFLDLSYGYKLSEYAGLITGLRGRINGVDFSAFSLPSGTQSRASIESTVWKSAAFTLGLFQQLPLNNSKRFLFEMKGLAGVQRISSPEIEAYVSIPGMGSGSNKQESYTATSFVYLFGTALTYNFNSSIGLKFSLDYTGSKPEFKKVDAFDSNGNKVKVSARQNIDVLDLGIGLVIPL